MIFHHGLKFAESTEARRYLATAATAVIGLVAVAADADATAFPADTPVLVTDLRAAIAKAGDDDSLAPALQAISDQANTVAVIVRAVEGADAAATETAVSAAVQKLVSAQSVVGFRPKILGAPGFDTQVVAAKLAETARKLRGFAYASAGGDGADTIAEAVTYRGEFSERELMLLYPDGKRGADQVHAAALAMGLRARIDREMGWHKTISNVPLSSVTGIVQPISYDFEDMTSDAGVLNAADITALINDTGYRFWGNRTCSDEPSFAFESTVRTNHVLKDTIAQGMRTYADKPLHPTLIRDILEEINAKFRELVRQGRLIGATAWFDPAENPNNALAAGKCAIRYDFTDVPPLEELGVTVTKTDVYFANFAAGVVGG
jgi:phage tail sheath protein FI